MVEMENPISGLKEPRLELLHTPSWDGGERNWGSVGLALKQQPGLRG